MVEIATEEETKQRYLHFLRKDIKGAIYWLNALFPDFMEAEEALKELLEWTPEFTDVEQFKKSPYYVEGDEKAPFFTEAYLYNLLGKQDARTLLCLMRGALGIKGIGKHL